MTTKRITVLQGGLITQAIYHSMVRCIDLSSTIRRQSSCHIFFEFYVMQRGLKFELNQIESKTKISICIESKITS